MEALPLVARFLFLLLLPPIYAIPEQQEMRCEHIVRSWSETELTKSVPQDYEKLRLRDLLFFLHIPRTGGRTYHQCFLKHLFGSDERCPRSYDKLRIDTRQPGCRLISTHDDFSVLRMLPDNIASVVTNLRNPLDRVLSSYEFSVEVASRFLRHYKTGTTVRTGKPRTGSRQMSTLDIWPWKYLVPMMQKDIFARRDAREAGLLKSLLEVPFNHSYDVESIVMPFQEFIDHPLAHELVHNGATFQIAGLTNNSYIEVAKEIRSCVVKYKHLGQYVLSVAKRRLDIMLYVGLTENQEESVTFFANVLRGQIPMERRIKDPEKSQPEGHPVSISKKRSYEVKENLLMDHQLTELNRTSETKDQDVIDDLLDSYETCVSDLRFTQESRRVVSLELIAPINFTRKERKLIPESVTGQVVHLNSLDVELYSHAQMLFAKQQYLLEHGLNKERDSQILGRQNGKPQEGELNSVQQNSSLNVVVIGVLVTFFGLVMTTHVLLKKKFPRELTPSRGHHSLFMKFWTQDIEESSSRTDLTRREQSVGAGIKTVDFIEDCQS